MSDPRSLMKDSSSLSVDPSSPDDPVENRFFQQGLDQEGNPKEEPLDFDDQTRRHRRFIWIGGGAVTLCALGLLLLMGRPEPLVPPMAGPVAATPAPSVKASVPPAAAVPPPAVAAVPAPRPPPVPAPTAPVAQTAPPLAQAAPAVESQRTAASPGLAKVAAVPALAAPVPPVTRVGQSAGV